MWAAVAIGSDTHIWREGVYVYPVPPPLLSLSSSRRRGPVRRAVAFLCYPRAFWAHLDIAGKGYFPSTLAP